MPNANATLPENLKGLIENIATHQAIPLGELSELPFLAIKTSDAALLKKGGVTCEFKPSVLNIDFGDKSVAACIVQFRINDDNAQIYTVIYDLGNDKQFGDCYGLLRMERYGLLIATDSEHEFVAFDTRFEGSFDPRLVIAEAKAHCKDSTPELFYGIMQAFYNSQTDAAALWKQLEKTAPYEKGWYGRMRMEARET